MKGKTKGWLIAASLLVLVGLAICAGTMQHIGWDFRKLGTEHYETNVYDITKKFNDIAINTDTADIAFELSADGKCKVVCHEIEKMPHSAIVKDNVLEITWTDNRELHEHIGIATETPEITVYLPRNEYDTLYIKETTGDIDIPKDFRFENIEICTTTGDVKCCASAEESFIIETDTGDIKSENISADKIELSVNTGDITLGNVDCEGPLKIGVSTGIADIRGVKCESLVSEGDTGDLTLTNVIASGNFNIERTTGDVIFKHCDAAEIFVRTDTGDVKGSLLSEKYFVIETDTGDVDVPRTTGGGKCEIITDTGDIEITEEQK